MRTRCFVCFGLIVASAGFAAPRDVAAQQLTVTPTYQVSYRQFEGFNPFEASTAGSDYRAWGLMVGLIRPGRWWTPHLWFEKYEIGQVCSPSIECGNDGWSLSVGPALEIMESGPLAATLVPQLGMQARGSHSFTGGLGLHIGVDAGRLAPQVFTRFTTRNRLYYGTIGFGVKFTFDLPRKENRRPY